MGDFVKYYNGKFCEAGNCGKESPIVSNAWHPRVAYSKKEKLYYMSSKQFFKGEDNKEIMDIRTGVDMLHWSAPVQIEYEGKPFGSHYNAIVSNDKNEQPNVINGDNISILINHNGTDVLRYDATLE